MSSNINISDVQCQTFFKTDKYFKTLINLGYLKISTVGDYYNTKTNRKIKISGVVMDKIFDQFQKDNELRKKYYDDILEMKKYKIIDIEDDHMYKNGNKLDISSTLFINLLKEKDAIKRQQFEPSRLTRIVFL